MGSSGFIHKSFITTIRHLGLRHSKNPYKRLRATKNNKKNCASKGFVPIYVGEEGKKYEVPVKYLSTPAFQELITRFLDDDQVEPKINGPIVLVCRIESFDQFLKFAKKNH